MHDHTNPTLVTAAAVANALANLVVAEPDHPYFVTKGVKSDASAYVYDGDQIAGVDCKGSLMVVVRNAKGKPVNMLLMIENESGEYEELLMPGAQIAGAWVRIGDKTDTICVATDYASGLSLHEVTGNCVAVALYDKNVLSVCESLRQQHPESSLAICLGASRGIDRAAIRRLCNETASLVGARIAIPHGAATFNQLHQTQGAKAVRNCVDSAQEPQNLELTTEASGDDDFPHVIAWPNRVNTAGVMADAECQISRYVVLPAHSIVAIVLWILFTHVINAVRVTPILALLSAVKRCGKTSTVAIIELLVSRPFGTVNISPAAVYHAVKLKPTMLIDEADQFIHQSSNELTGVINSGHTRTSAYVQRVIGGRLRKFSTFCAKLLAMIGLPPETILDRCIVIELQRKHTEQRVAKYVPADNDDMVALRARIEAFAQNDLQRVKNAHFEVPDLGNDRALDNWVPLIAVASCGGAAWVQKATEAAVALTTSNNRAQDVIEELLQDVCQHFRKTGAAFLTTVAIIEDLCHDKEKRWSTHSRGRPLSPHDLATLMRQVGCRSRQQRIGQQNLRGYHLDDLKDLFTRYFPGAPI